MDYHGGSGALRWHENIPLFILLAACAAFFRSVLGGYFLADDFGYIQLYSRISLPRFRALFVNDWSQGIWGFNLQELRPLVGFTYWLEYKVWGVDAFGYHLTNLLLYVLVVAGFWLFVREFARAVFGASAGATAVSWMSALAGLLFMLHPAHVEAVAWIAGRTDLLAACTYFWSLYFLACYWRKGKPAFSYAGIAVYACGVFMKENVVTLPAAFLLFAVLTGTRNRWRELLGIAGVLLFFAGLWATFRYIAFGAVGNSSWTGFLARVPYYADQIMPVSSEIGLTAGLIFVATVIAALLIDWRRASRTIVFWGVGWPTIHVLPLVAVHYDSPRHVFLLLAGPIVTGVLTGLIVARRSWLLAAPLIAGNLLLSGIFWDQDTERLALWDQSSRYSRQLSTMLESTNYDAGSIVLFNTSPKLPVWFRQWTLPFALEEPFMDFAPRFVAKPDWYCCESWAKSKQDLLGEIESGTASKVYTVDFDEGQERFVSR